MSNYRYKAEAYNRGWVVYDTVTMEPYQTWADQDDAHQHADELTFDWIVVERDALKALNAELLKALKQIAEGCSFPEDEVQKAVVRTARAAIAKAEGGANG